MRKKYIEFQRSVRAVRCSAAVCLYNIVYIYISCPSFVVISFDVVWVPRPKGDIITAI